MSDLKKLRELIDKNDKRLLEILAKRFEITKRVGEYKKKHSLKAKDKKREKEVFKMREVWSKELNISPVLVKQIFKLIIKDVCRKHKEISNEKR